MKRREADLDRMLDQALNEIREETPDSKFVAEATEQVWSQLAAHESAGKEEAQGPRRIESCAGFQELIPAYLNDALERNSMLLLKDHLGECVPCRRVYKKQSAARNKPAAASSPAKGRSWVSTLTWRVAAAAAIFVALVGVSVKTDVFTFETGGLIRIEAVEGELFRVSDEGSVPLQAGQELTLNEGERIRTAKDSSAVLAMADASQIEMRERSELAVMEKRSFIPGRKTDGVVDLARGSVIVEASDQGSGHIFVSTHDCDVAVKGTVFAVNSGIKGSRISVIEGEVHVQHSGEKDVLFAGQQTTTSRSLTAVPVEDEIAWSQNRDRYFELLREMRALSQELDEAFQPGLRYSTRLLDLAPADAAIFFTMPNVSDELSQAYEILQSRMASNEILASWWDQEMMAGGHGADFERVIEKIAAFGDPLGEELTMTVHVNGGSDVSMLFLTELENPAEFRALVEQELAELGDQVGDASIHFFEGELPATAPANLGSEEAVFFWATDGLLALTPHFHQLQALQTVLEGGSGTTISGSSFHDSLAELYEKGVEWAVAVDLETLIRADDPSDLETLEAMGLLDVQHIIGERRQIDGRTENRVAISFDQPRRRIASWLADPAPIGAMQFISPDATLAAAFAMKDMGTLVDELFTMISSMEPSFEDELNEFQQLSGIDIRQDFAAALGGEFVLAVDGPMLPKPSWKLAIEVYDPARLQQSLAWVVEQINAELADSDVQGLKLDHEQVGAREFFVLESLDTGIQVHYVFDDGYVVFAPSRGLLERALQSRVSGIQLTDAPDFVELLPHDGEVNFSAAFYHNLGPVLGPLSRTIAGSGLGDLSADQTQFLQELASESKPGLMLAYGEPTRITFTSDAEGGLFSSGLSSLSGVGGLLGMQQSLLSTLAQAHSSDGSGSGDQD